MQWVCGRKIVLIVRKYCSPWWILIVCDLSEIYLCLLCTVCRAESMLYQTVSKSHRSVSKTHKNLCKKYAVCVFWTAPIFSVHFTQYFQLSPSRCNDCLLKLLRCRFFLILSFLQLLPINSITMLTIKLPSLQCSASSFCSFNDFLSSSKIRVGSSKSESFRRGYLENR